ncbi:hypothetical protein BO70DRAFT_398649 [Aspergillus heteromorphus CBS 117.55]|uniref:Uncharacterized protein n=1 Tax=Aspergillus heteromorphus CBS 117.55 TaxID=1448321 RepID=A0A317VL72_9EURO|nr:uncharacterized protein BO70DRAFT_398649 [Aspergillus heteromorphus CBS 117.55]PWY74319.1 hypothetical protein BO70DRAFT_398649 [Aspergillus heteromorphus CBS 117.55]
MSDSSESQESLNVYHYLPSDDKEFPEPPPVYSKHAEPKVPEVYEGGPGLPQLPAFLLALPDGTITLTFSQLYGLRVAVDNSYSPGKGTEVVPWCSRRADGAFILLPKSQMRHEITMVHMSGQSKIKHLQLVRLDQNSQPETWQPIVNLAVDVGEEAFKSESFERAQGRVFLDLRIDTSFAYADGLATATVLIRHQDRRLAEFVFPIIPA